MIFHKFPTYGYTSFLIEPFLETTFQFCQVVAYIDNSAIDFDDPVLLGQVSLVETFKTLVSKADELDHVLIPGDRLSDIIDLSACVVGCAVRKKKDGIDLVSLWRNVDKLPIWRLPYAMKLRFEKNPSPSMDTPTKLLFAARSRNMLWNDCETFVDWLRNNGPKWHQERLFGRNGLAEF